VEDFNALLIRLKESEVPFVDTRKIGYEFDIILARMKHLAHRCSSAGREITRIYTITEMRMSTELNKRLEKLTEIMKRLTAITIILMIPTVITSHYGMNFKYMPELSDPNGYLLATGASVSLVLGTALYFRHKGWI
jgi:Mg2+ and Co2+ transporter CorA